jgi:hypothetical protein
MTRPHRAWNSFKQDRLRFDPATGTSCCRNLWQRRSVIGHHHVSLIDLMTSRPGGRLGLHVFWTLLRHSLLATQNLFLPKSDKMLTFNRLRGVKGAS